MLVHPRTTYWRSRTRSPYLVLLPIWAAMWTLLGILSAPWRSLVIYQMPWTWIPATLLLVVGLWTYRSSGTGFSAAQLGGLPELTSGDHNQQLVMTGIRGRVRHPIYLAHLCEMLVWSIGTGLAVCYALTAFAVLTGAVMIPLEEKELEQRFGEGYRVYRQRVPALIPKI